MQTQPSILITGCSSGIGLESALTLHQRGYQVFAGVRKTADLERLKSLGLENALIIDVDDDSSIIDAVNSVTEKTGGTLDAVFNNAGFVLAGAVEDLSREALEAQFSTNVYGPIQLIRHILPIMRRQGHGRIIQNSSILGQLAMPFRGAYNASKFALEGFTDTLRQELRDTPIHVILIEPGPIKTALRENAKQAFQQHIDTEHSIHQSKYQRMRDYFNRNEKTSGFTADPELVVKKLLHALQSKRPRTRYKVGFITQILALLKAVLPDRTFDSLACLAVKDETRTD